MDGRRKISLDTLAENTLASVMFSDIFLSSDEADPILVVNLSGEAIRTTKSRGPEILPDIYRSDARNLFRAVERTWSAERFAPEFNLVYDNLVYRCSQIAALETAIQIPREVFVAESSTFNTCLFGVEMQTPCEQRSAKVVSDC